MKELFLDKSLVTNPNVTGELVLVYIALRKVMSDEVPLFSKETSVGIVSLNKMAFVLTGLCTEYAKVGCSCCCIKHGNSYVYRFRLRLAGENLVSLF